jgi:rubrerythrin
MEQWKTVEEVLDFAIKNEENARDFYTKLAGKMERPAMKTVFEGFAMEEEGHKKLLLKVKETGGFAPSSENILDLKIGDYLVPVETEGDLSYQDALILAMKKEKMAYKLYTNLSAAVSDDSLRSTLTSLANEEAKHKLRFEIEYDDQFMKDQ